MTELNVANTLQQLYQQSDIIRQMVVNDEIGLVGALYDVSSGKVHFRDFAPLVEHLNGKKMNHEMAQHLKKVFDEAVHPRKGIAKS